MKTKAEIKKYLEEIEKDERLSYPDANVFVNAPLALIQVELKNKIAVLEWVLEEQK